MCLTSKEKLPIQTATSDMVVYKILYKSKDNKLHGPFFGFDISYKMNTKRHEFLCEMRPVVNFSSENLETDHYSSSSGLYSYTTKESARSLIVHSFLKPSRYKIYECVIPKGSSYITDGDVVISDCIIIKRKCIFQ